MADTFLLDALPVADFASAGSTISLEDLLKQSYGDEASKISSLRIWYESADDFTSSNFSYWDPNNPQIGKVLKNGVDIGSEFSNAITVSQKGLDNVSIEAGNNIGANIFIQIQVASGPGGQKVWQDLPVKFVDPSLDYRSDNDGVPDPADIAAAALQFGTTYNNIANENDCHFIAAAIAASVGATFDELSGATQSITTPPNNQEEGFWRIAYNGTSTTNWSTLLQPGDIVRLGWQDGGFHTFTVIEGPRASDGKIEVTDNFNDVISTHWANYDDIVTADEQSNDATVTIYRLSADHLYLTNGSSLGDTLYGTIFNDDLRGNDGNDNLYGGVGDDSLSGGAGADTLHGGAGDDTYYLTDATKHAFDTVVEDENAGTDTVYVSQDTGINRYTLPKNIEVGHITGTGNNFVLIGNVLDNQLYGAAGNDQLQGGHGADTLVGGGGTDWLKGGPGDDIYVLNTLTPSGGYDKITEYAHEGTDTVDITFYSSVLEYTLPDNVENGYITPGLGPLENQGGHVLEGNALDNQLYGSNGDDTLVGGAGDDQLHGGAGYDTLYGGTGNDTYFLDDVTGSGYDSVAEFAGGGTDTVDVSMALYGSTYFDSYTLPDFVEIGVVDDANGYAASREVGFNLTGNDLDNTLTGGAENDLLVGGGGADTLNGGAGFDVLAGGPGDDTYILDDAGIGDTGYQYDQIDEDQDGGTDTVEIKAVQTPDGPLNGYFLAENVENSTVTSADGFSLVGNDLANKLAGNAGADSLEGGNGDDFLTGGGGNDVLIGDDGADRLVGNAGKDDLQGGGGADTFVFRQGDSKPGAANRDFIQDFSGASGDGDKIDVSAIDADNHKAFHQHFTFIGSQPFHGTSQHPVYGELHVIVNHTVEGDDFMVEGDVNGDGKADFQIEVASAVALVKADFIL